MSQHRLAFGALVAFLLWVAWPSSGVVYVANNDNIAVYANGANGNVPPLRKIEGNATELAGPHQIFADALHDELYSANFSVDSITVYPLQGSGDLPPVRSVVGAATLLLQPTGVAVDLTHDELVALNFGTAFQGSINVYPRTANGDTAPIRRITGDATGLVWTVQVALDPVANEIFVLCQGQDAVPAGVRVFQRTAHGDVAPIRTIAGLATRLDTPYGIALDLPRQQILVTTREGAILVFPLKANGNVAPVQRIAGPISGLLETLGVSLLGSSEIVVTNYGLAGNNFTDDAVLVFGRNANGDRAPRRRITGPASGVHGPVGIAAAPPRLGLRAERFGVQAVFRTVAGVVGDGIPVQLTSDTGYLWFFEAPNVEVVVKVLDGCGFNQHYWVFAAGLTDTNVDLIVTDYQTGVVRTYTNPQKTKFQPIQDTKAFTGCPPASPARYAPEDSFALASEPRSVVGDALFLNNERFEVRAEWEDRHGATGIGHPVAITGDTGYFWFFFDSNVEVVVKVINGCGFNERYWVFAGGLTDVRVVLTVLDKVQGTATRTYVNPQRAPFQPIQDIQAFATCP